MNELALFAGAGGGILGGYLLGWRTRCAVEIDPYCRSVLLARQRDGMLPRFPIWDDIRTFNGKPWRGSVGVLGARHIGAPHRRDRMWILAERSVPTDTDSYPVRVQSWRRIRSDRQKTPLSGVADWWRVPPPARVDDGMAHRMDRVRATGNGQVPGVAVLAFNVLKETLNENA